MSINEWDIILARGGQYISGPYLNHCVALEQAAEMNKSAAADPRKPHFIVGVVPDKQRRFGRPRLDLEAA